MNKYLSISTLLIAQLLGFSLLLFVFLFTVGCASEPPKQKEMTLLSCMAEYRRHNPYLDQGLAYAYCVRKIEIINQNNALKENK
jgi:hypothetical protein